MTHPGDRHLLYRSLIILVVFIQLASPISAAAMPWLTAPAASRPAESAAAPSDVSWFRAPGETREAFFTRVGQQNPEHLQLAALRALEYYLNHPSPAAEPADAFERLVEKYLALPGDMLSQSGAQLPGLPATQAWEPVQSIAAGPPNPAAPAPALLQAAPPKPAAAATQAAIASPVATDAPVAPVVAVETPIVTSTAELPPSPAATAATPTLTATAVVTAAPTATATPVETVPPTPAPTRTALPSPTPAPTTAPTRTPVATATARAVFAPSRETRTAGVIKITADTFTDLGNGQTKAEGNVVIGDYLPLLGANDYLTYDANSLTATITLAVQVGSEQVELFTGSITAPVGTGLATLGTDVNYALSRIAGFPISAGLAISQIDLTAAVVSGTATLHLNPPGVDTTAATSFTISAASGGISYAGSLQAFSLSVAGVTLDVPQGATISGSGVQAPSVTLSLPATFGGLTTTVSNLQITTGSFTLGGAQTTFALPDLRIGGAATAPVQFTGNQATLTFDDGTQAYLLTISSTLALSLPGNTINTPASVTLGSTGGQPVLSGTLDSLSLTVAGATLAMSNLQVSNDGLSVAQATLTLPAKLGGASGTISQVSITKDGLTFAGATITLPDINFGDGSQLKITAIQATLTQQNNQYAFTASATLAINLPGNAQNIAITLAVDGNGDVSGTVSQVTLNVAGTSLAMSSLTIDDTGLSVAQATLTLPAKLGGESATVTGITITKDGLAFESATITLPDIKYGDGSKLKITGIQATLAQQNNQYTFTASATLQINLPGNARSIGLSLTVNGNGDVSGTVTGAISMADGSTSAGITLNLAGASLNLVSPTIGNTGVSVAAATLTLPASLGSTSVTISNVSIGKDGLSFGGASIALPDIKFGDGSKLKVVGLTASVTAAASGYTFSLSGTLQVRLPGNSEDISITGSIDTAGHLSATVTQLNLNIASVTLKMTGLTMDNSGLSVSSATLNLPGKLGNASGSVTNVTITSDGLKIGGATAEISFPDFKIGSTNGFAVTGVKATIEITDNGSAYNVTLTGTVAITIPGASASASGSVSINSQGAISGSVQSFSLGLAGLTLSAQNIQIASDGSFSISSAKLVLPSGFGGGYVQLNNVVIRPGGGSNAVSIGGGSFQLPKISVGGFNLQVSGSLQKVDGGYQITASGLFNMPSLGGAGGCSGIQVSVTLYATSSGQTVMEIEPAPKLAERPDWMVSYPTSPAGLKLKNVSLALNCSLPIGDTGFFMTSLSGSVTLDENSTTISVAVQISAGQKVAGVAVASANAQATVTADPFSLALSGTIKVFTFSVGGASASIKPSQFTATLWINAVVLRGQVTVNAWSDTKGFHLTGTATMVVGIPKASIYQGCFTWLCCPNGHKYDGVNCWPWKVHKCQTCICIPPVSLDVANVSVQVGEFSTPSGGDAWGFKGEVTVLGYTAAFYVDTNGTLKVGGDVNKYHLVTEAQIRAAQGRWMMARVSGAIPSGADWIDSETGVVFTADGEILVPVEMDNPRHASFEMTRFGAAPGLELIRPDGVHITPTSLPAGVGYTEVTTYTVAGEPELALPGVATADLAPVVVPSTATTVQAAGAQALVLANRFASRAGIDPSVRPAISSVTSTEATTATARLRFVHALAEVPAVDVLLDDVLLFRNIAYGAATPYVSVTADSHVISIVPAGAAVPELARVTVSLDEATDNSAVAIGQAASPTLLALVDDNTRPDAGKARVRVVHASADAPAVDLALDADSPAIYDIAYAAASETVPVDAGRHDLHVRTAGTTSDLLLIPGVDLADSRVYTIFVMGLYQDNGQYPLRAVLSQDAASAGRMRFIHAMQAEPYLDVMADGQPLFVDVPYASDPNSAQGPYTPYAALAPGDHLLTVSAPGTPNALLGTLALTVLPDQDITVVGVPFYASDQGGTDQLPVRLWAVVDDNSLPSLGQARMRLIDAVGEPRAVDLAISGGETLIRGVSHYSTSEYVSLAGSTYTLEVRDAATSEVLAVLPDVDIQAGLVYSVIVRDGAAGPIAEVTADQVAQQTTQVAYEVDEPSAGTWQLVLTGDIGANDQYVLGVTGAVANATLTGVTVSPVEVNAADVGWRLVSSQVTTTVGIYANPGSIETMLVVTNTDGTTTTVTSPLFAGYALAENLTGDPPGWTNGSAQSQRVDLDGLPSGAYHIWVQADDGRTNLAQVYAGTVVTVSHTWNENWAAGLTAVPSYRTLTVTWDRHPNPDIDRYQLKLGTEVGAAEHTVNVGDSLSYTFTGLNPDQQYTLWMEGVDSETGRVSRSDVIRATPLGAPFTLTGPEGTLALTSGEAREITLTLSTTEANYPDAVVLSAGCQPVTATLASTDAQLAAPDAECLGLPDGIALTLPGEPLTPTLAGVQARAVISTANTLLDGTYTVPIVARGGGVERLVDLTIEAQRPYFRLSGAPAGVVLGAKDTSVIQISATGFHGTSDGITLALEDVPEGLQWAFGRIVIRPGEQTALTLVDTELLGSGSYTLRVIGHDGRVTDELALLLEVRKPQFSVTAQPSKTRGLVGRPGVALYDLALTGQNDWTTPVTLSVADAAPPPHGALGLSLTPTSSTGEPTVTVTPPGHAYAIVAWAADTPPGLYLFTVQAVGGEQFTPVNLALELTTRLTYYLPLITKQ